MTVSLNQILAMPVLSGEVEVARLHQLIANTAQHLCVVSITQFGHQDSDCQSTAIAERAREMARLIIEFLGGSFDSVTSGLGDRTAGNVVEHNRNRGGIQAEILRQFFQADWAIYRRLLLFSFFAQLSESLILNARHS